METLTTIALFIRDSFLAIWPYLLITIPLAVAVNMSGASKHIRRAFQAGPILAIVLATAVGAFSPFCSCGVIPIVASLLIGGVPLAPVMAFWIASPSMDPEIFFLSVGVLGWELAVWRLAGTLVLSFGAGLITHLVTARGWLGEDILRRKHPVPVRSRLELVREGWRNLRAQVARVLFAHDAWLPVAAPAVAGIASGSPTADAPPETPAGSCSGGCCGDGEAVCTLERPTFTRRLLRETWAATRMVVQFMALAFLLEALIMLFVPQTWVAGLLGSENRWSVLLAALLGVPVYTSNLTALPLIGGLLSQGMNPAAALAFLIAGPTTTLPAMAAVWGLVQRRVFLLYMSFALAGALAAGVLFSLASG